MISITQKSECCGCSACKSICPKKCIQMREDEEGFLYPKVNIEVCVKCGLCEKVCPILNKEDRNKYSQEGYVVQHKDERILRESTAGGAFTAIAEHIISLDGIVFGVKLDKNFNAKHTYVDNVGDLKVFRNSKYIQSDVGETYQQAKSFLEEDRYVCFSGTPCQIEGLIKYLGRGYEKLVTVDVVCRSVPSPLIFKKYLQYQEQESKYKIKDIKFRDKYYGYKYSTMNIIADRNRGNYHKGIESDAWLRAFFSNICNRPSCYKCEFRSQYRSSDFTIWDCFNVGRFNKELDNDKGATRIIVHTDKAKQLFKEISQNLKYEKVDLEKLTNNVRELEDSPELNKKRREFFEDAIYMDGKELFEKYFPTTIQVNIKRLVRMMCYRLGIYSIAKNIYVKLTHKY